MAYYDIYRERLANMHATFGHALWKPAPNAGYGPVRIGDVGYVREGKFHHLFNALLPSNDRSHQEVPLPEYHEPLTLKLQSTNHISTDILNPNDFCSAGVDLLPAEPEHLATSCPEYPEFSFSCKRRQGGALLSLPVGALGQDTCARGAFGKWMLQHIDSWFSFARSLGLGIDHMEEIILVTGCHHTRTWANVVFLENQTDAQASFGIRMSRSHAGHDVSIKWEFPLGKAQGAVRRWGPDGNLNNLEEDQCIFIRGFRVVRNFGIFPKQLRGAAGPNPNLDDDQDDGPDEGLGPIPASKETRDLLHVLIDYIAERSPDCDMVLVHDDDLARTARLHDDDETLRRETLMAYLQQVQPEICQIRCSHLPTSDDGPSTGSTTVAMFMKEFHEWSDRHDHDIQFLSSKGSESGAQDHGRRSMSPSSLDLGRSVSPGSDFKQLPTGPMPPDVAAVPHEGASSQITHRSPLGSPIPDFDKRGDFQNESAPPEPPFTGQSGIPPVQGDTTLARSNIPSQVVPPAYSKNQVPQKGMLTDITTETFPSSSWHRASHPVSLPGMSQPRESSSVLADGYISKPLNPDYSLLLNNYLQSTGEVHLLSWEFSQIGPEDQTTHTAVAKLRGYPVSQGSATTRAVARQIASYHFLKLRRQI